MTAAQYREAEVGRSLARVLRTLPIGWRLDLSLKRSAMQLVLIDEQGSDRMAQEWGAPDEDLQHALEGLQARLLTWQVPVREDEPTAAYVTQ